ncbi:MAG: dihydrolipoamide acetyltransferase family protein [Candidatus Sericytochromatia bacterium]|nr:dihydrolipoamide acetyltransferase family protein [Candidatus Sericytochromatia bacterium]
MSHVTLVEIQPGQFEFRLPDIGEGVVEGEIVKWLVAEGQAIKEDEPIVEIMTDKATVEIPSPKSGTVARRFWTEGQICPVGQALVLIVSEGSVGAAALPVTEVDAPAKQEVVVAVASGSSNGHGSVKAGTAVLERPSGERALAAPATRKLARDLGVDLQLVPGSGPHGRVTRDDVQAFAAGPTLAPVASVPAIPVAVAATSPAISIAAGPGDERRPLRGLRRKIAEKMVQSAFTAPHVTTFDEVDMTALVGLRQRMKPRAEALGVKLSYMPFFIKAVIAALKQFPSFNASLDDTTQEIVIKRDYHIGFAAATDNGLLVPVIRHADRKSLLEIARDMADIAARTRAGKATAEELSGSTFTISNVGSIGGLFATPIINHPEVAILGVNNMQKRAVVLEDGTLAARDMMYLGLSFDHRVNDGAEAVLFLNAVIGYLKDPETLLMTL